MYGLLKIHKWEELLMKQQNIINITNTRTAILQLGNGDKNV